MDEAARSERWVGWDRTRLSRLETELARAAAEAELVGRNVERLRRVAATAVTRRYRQHQAAIAAAAPYTPSAFRRVRREAPLQPRLAAAQCQVWASSSSTICNAAPISSTHTTVPGGSAVVWPSWPVIVDVRSLAASSPSSSSPSRPELAAAVVTVKEEEGE
jgi:hypothetical protein